ncbi:MAG: GIY-YIG nuclease family protein [Bacteroidetes bacterium]|nr:GIY-YIG nuclease family protein [Bacteroidota bacterium]MBK9415499.1 GIY-YIG nuclease family protein [Bacteroidota bacterium]
MFFVYIIYCKTADIFYVGSTDDYERRLVEHNNHEKNKFTSKFDFWELKLVLAFNSRAEAMKMEKFIKKQKSKLFIEKLILGENLTGNLAQLVRVPHVRD